MKKLIALVIVAVMLLSMMPMMALAADTIYYVTGEDLDPAWGWNAAAQKMEKEGDVYTYTVPYVFPRSKSYEYKITKGDWSWGCPSSGNNSITVSELSSVKITYNPTTNTASAEATPLTDYSTESITLHVNAAAMTSGAPYLWAWKQDGTNLYSDWPGKVIPADEYNGGWYTISMGWDYIGFLINNGASSNTVQTANVSAYAGQELWITVDSNKVVTKSFSAPSGWKTADDTYVITLDLGYEGCADASTLITTDGKITLPADPSRENYTFNGWFTKAEGGEPVDDDTVYTGSTTIYAQWTPNQPAVVDYYLIGYINGANYGCEGDSANMGTYKFVNGKLTVTFTADSYVFVKTTNNANWYMTDGYPGDTATSAVFYNTTANIRHDKLKVPANTEVEFTLTVNSANDTLTLSYEPTNAGGGATPPADPTYIVAGSAGLCGAEWAADNADNKMTKNGDVYTITYTDVAPGNYEFKVTDGTWTNSWPGSNYTFGVTATGDVTITFNPETKEITVTGDTLGEYVPDDDDDDEQGGGSVTPPPTTEMITVHAKVPTDWEAAYLYAWSASPYKTWPGAEMAKGSEGWWTVKIPANMENIIVTADSAGPQTVDKSITDFDGDVIWIILGEKNPDGYYLAEVTDTKPSSFKDEYAGNYVPPAAPTDFYLVGYINGADYYETTHKFVNGKLTITLTADSYAMIKDNNGDVYGTAAYCTEKTANMAIGGGEKMFVPKGEITFTLTVNADGTVKLSYTVPTPEGGNEGGNQGGTEGGNQSGTTGNPEVPTGSLIIHAKVPAAWASAYLYAWNTGDDVMASWPGTAMTKGDDGWYTIEIPAGYKNIIVAEKNGGEQTVDLSIANVTGNEIWVTLGEKNSDGKYPATIAEDEKGEEIVAPPEVKQITVYAKVPANWTTPYVYAWNGSGNNASWPGVAMTKGENGWWYAKVPATAENVIISNNGKTQTVDLKLEKLSVDAFVQVAAAGADGKYTATVQYSTNPDTGDTAIIAPVVFLMVMSVTGLAVLTVGKKKYF